MLARTETTFGNRRAKSFDTVFLRSVGNDRIGWVHVVRNPEKFRHLEARVTESGL